MTIINPFQLPDRLSIEFRQDYLEFWAKVREYYQAMTGESFDQINLGHPNWRTITTSWNEDHVGKWVHSRAALLSCIHQVSGTPVLVDSSKLHHQLYLLCRSDLFSIKVIHPIRDGRAVADFRTSDGTTILRGVSIYGW